MSVLREYVCIFLRVGVLFCVCAFVRTCVGSPVCVCFVCVNVICAGFLCVSRHMYACSCCICLGLFLCACLCECVSV